MPESLHIATPTWLYTDAGAAERLGMLRPVVTRKRLRLGLGRQLGRVPVLTEAEVERIGQHDPPGRKPKAT